VAESATDRGRGEAHWDAVYRDRGTEEVSWFQSTPTVSIGLIRRLNVPHDAAILDVGGGASTLIDVLLADGFSDLTVLDISEVALKALRRRLAAEAPVKLFHGDLLGWTPERHFDVWHDRAVFHFLVDDDDRRKYLELLRRALRKGGHVIVGTFAEDGPRYCSGLRVARYTLEALSDIFRTDFDIVEHEHEQHTTPAGVVQPFNWLAARRRDEPPRGSTPSGGTMSSARA
jgi:SAM-dependent methyltransferase